MEALGMEKPKSPEIREALKTPGFKEAVDLLAKEFVLCKDSIITARDEAKEWKAGLPKREEMEWADTPVEKLEAMILKKKEEVIRMERVLQSKV